MNRSCATVLVFLAMLFVFGAASTTGAQSDCATELGFLSVTAAPANSAYVAPQLSVNCDGTTVTMNSNNIPNFEFVQITPADLQANQISYSFPQSPRLTGTTTEIPIVGTTAVTVGGLAIFGPNEAPRNGYRDPYLDNLLDFCGGHTAEGFYHHHTRPDCLYTAEELATPGSIIGYSLDGFPILVPYVYDSSGAVVEVTSSWQYTNPDLDNAWEANEYVADSGDLDQCNGLENPNIPDFAYEYAYFATDTFPYFMGCYVGTASDGGGVAQMGGAGQGQGQGQPPQGGQGQQGQGQPPQGGRGQVQGQPPQGVRGGQGQLPPPPPSGGGG